MEKDNLKLNYSHEKIMERWDSWRKYISEGGLSSWPRDEFEGLLDWFEEKLKEK